jgi:leader peptidase (prepilin peptidase)/N-methyltransferase
MFPVVVSLNLLGVLFAAVLGSLFGSFANVVVHRLPKGVSIAFPGSHCPACNHRLSALELVPVLSWAVQGGRCRSCRSPISLRYPSIELTMAIGFALLWWRWPPTTTGWTFVPLAALFALLVILAAIDLDTYTLPDVLTLPALAVALLAPLLYPAGSGLPTPAQALAGAAVGAGVLSLVNRLGALVLRRFRDTDERLWPLGFDQVNLAALGGAVAGWQAGIVAAGVSLAGNLMLRRCLRVPEPVLWLLWALALAAGLAGLTVPPVTSLSGTALAAGAVAIAGALFWWLRDITAPSEAEAGASDAGPAAGKPLGRGSAGAEGDVPEPDRDDGEPVAMGFGDVKLAAVMGALLGWEKLLLALFLSFLLGATGGIIGRLAGGQRQVPFGPYLVLATLLALFLGDALLGWYLGLLAY